MNSKKILIAVAEDGSLRIDGAEKTIADLTQPFLEQLVDKSLDGDVDYEIEGSMPLAKFFQKLQEGTKEGSPLREIKGSLAAEEGAKEGHEEPAVADALIQDGEAYDEDIPF